LLASSCAVTMSVSGEITSGYYYVHLWAITGHYTSLAVLAVV